MRVFYRLEVQFHVKHFICLRSLWRRKNIFCNGKVRLREIKLLRNLRPLNQFLICTFDLHQLVRSTTQFDEPNCFTYMMYQQLYLVKHLQTVNLSDHTDFNWSCVNWIFLLSMYRTKTLWNHRMCRLIRFLIYHFAFYKLQSTNICISISLEFRTLKHAGFADLILLSAST